MGFALLLSPRKREIRSPGSGGPGDPGRHREMEKGGDLNLKSSSFFQTTGVVFSKPIAIILTHYFYGWHILIKNDHLFPACITLNYILGGMIPFDSPKKKEKKNQLGSHTFENP